MPIPVSRSRVPASMLCWTKKCTESTSRVGARGLLSSAHTQADIDLTLAAWRRFLHALKKEIDLPQAVEARLSP